MTSNRVHGGGLSAQDVGQEREKFEIELVHQHLDDGTTGVGQTSCAKPRSTQAASATPLTVPEVKSAVSFMRFAWKLSAIISTHLNQCAGKSWRGDPCFSRRATRDIARLSLSISLSTSGPLVSDNFVAQNRNANWASAPLCPATHATRDQVGTKPVLKKKSSAQLWSVQGLLREDKRELPSASKHCHPRGATRLIFMAVSAVQSKSSVNSQIRRIFGDVKCLESQDGS